MFSISGPIGALGLVAETALKGTLLLALAWIVTRIMRRGSAAARHLVWASALGAFLVLPILVAAMPAWRIVPGSTPGAKLLESRALARSDRAADEPPVSLDLVTGKTEDVPTSTRSAPDVESESSPPPRIPSVLPLRTAMIVFVLWAFGAVAVLGAFVGGHVALRRLVRDARAFDDAGWLILAQQCAARLGLARPYALLRSASTFMPLTFGVLEPRLLMPSDAAEWPEDLRRAVLLHELAHVQRRDCLTQTMSQLACAAFWFHPGVWYAARQLCVERERACDDRVLAADTRASDYADHLLDVVKARRAPSVSALGAVAFARPTQLEGRLLAVLDPSVPRSGVTSRLFFRVAGFTAVLALGVAALAPAPRTVAAKVRRDPRMTGASVVVRAPEGLGGLSQRLTWALGEASRRHDADFWIAYRLAPNDRVKGGVIGGDEGFDLSLLDGNWAGPTLEDLVQGVTPRRNAERVGSSRGPVALQLGGSVHNRVFELAHLRFQNIGLPTDLHNRPLYWLGQIDDAESIAWLQSLMDGAGATRFRSELVEAIALHGRSDLVVPDLTARLERDADVEVRKAAAEGLSRHPSPDVERLLIATAKDDRSTEVRQAATESLGRLGTPEAMNALIDITRSSRDDARVRRSAFDAIGEELAARAPDRRAGQDALDQQEALDEEQDPKLNGEKYKKEEYKEEKYKARLHGADLAETEVQRQAVESLGRFPEAKVLPKLIEMTNHPNPEVARQAVESIGRYRSDAAYAVLTKIAWLNPVPEVQSQAVESMGRMKGGDTVASELIKIAKTHRMRETRRQAAETLGRLQGVKPAPLLMALAKETKDVEVARQAVESLGRLDDPGVTKALVDFARSHPMGEVRRQAVESLSRRDPDEALPYLETLVGGTREK